MSAGHTRLRRLIFPAFRAPSWLIALSWAVTHGIAGVRPTITGAVKAVTRGASGRGGNLRVILRRVLIVPADYKSFAIMETSEENADDPPAVERELVIQGH